MATKRAAKKAAAAPPPPPPPPAESSDETRSGSRSRSDDSEDDEEVLADSPVPAPTPTLKNAPAPSQKGGESESSEEEEEEEDDEEEEEPVRAAPKNQPPPPQKTEDSETSGDEEEEDDDEEEEEEEPQKKEPIRAAPPSALKKQPPQPQKKEDSDASGDEGESDEDEAPPPPPKPAPKKGAEAPKPPALALAPAAAETKKPGAAQRIWSTDDEVRILEALAAHQKQHGTFMQTDALVDVLAGKLDNPAYGSKELHSKVGSLRHRYKTLSMRAELPTKEHDRRLLQLGKLVWTGDKITSTSAATAMVKAANNGQERKGFEEMCELYPYLAEEMKGLEAAHPGLCKREFGKMDDDKARAMDEKIKRQRVAQIRLEMRRSDLAKEVSKALVDLVDA